MLKESQLWEALDVHYQFQMQDFPEPMMSNQDIVKKLAELENATKTPIEDRENKNITQVFSSFLSFLMMNFRENKWFFLNQKSSYRKTNYRYSFITCFLLNLACLLSEPIHRLVRLEDLPQSTANRNCNFIL